MLQCSKKYSGKKKQNKPFLQEKKKHHEHQNSLYAHVAPFAPEDPSTSKPRYKSEPNRHHNTFPIIMTIKKRHHFFMLRVDRYRKGT